MGAPVVPWLTAFLDGPADEDGSAWELWCAVTDTSLSPARGERGQFATLLPRTGDPHLRVQETAAGPPAVHLDLHVASSEDAAEHAVAVGAQVVARPGHIVLRSPGGFRLCLVPDHGERRGAPPTRWPGGHRSRLDQLSIDVAADHWERELEFWADLTGWDLDATRRPELVRLRTPERLPVRVLLQRRDEGATAGHVDVATDDRPAEVVRLEALGASRVADGPSWTVMAGPQGQVFCVTDRDPGTGLLR